MRVSIQSTNGNEAVVRGDAEFIGIVAEAIQRYENKIVNRKVQLDLPTQTSERKLAALERARKIKEQKRLAKLNKTAGKKYPDLVGKDGTTFEIKTKPKRKVRKHRAPRWTPEEDKKLEEFLNDTANYRFTRGKICINTKNLKQLARELRRTKKAVSLRIHCEKKFIDVKKYVIEQLSRKQQRTGSDTRGWFGG